jgi:hypothetical protein
MISLSSLICLAGLLAFAGAFWKAGRVRRDESRMAGYIASLKATAAAHRTRALDLEQAIRSSDTSTPVRGSTSSVTLSGSAATPLMPTTPIPG